MSDRRIALGLILLAIAARAAGIVALQSHTVPHSTYEHGEIAANLLAGRGFAVRYLGADGPTSQQAPLYPALVAVAYAIGGVESPRALLILELAQAALGGALVAAVLAWARFLMPDSRWVAPAAGLIVAADPSLVYAATHVQVASVATALLLIVLAWGERTARTGRPGDAVLAGVGLGVLTLADPILGLAAPGVAWSIIRGGGGRRSVWLVAVVGVAAAGCITPWVARNYRVHGEFVPIKSSFGYAFWQGNCALSEGTDKVVRASAARIADRPTASLLDRNRAMWEARHEAGYLDDIALSVQDYRELGAVSEPERARRLFRRARSDIAADPARYVRLCFRRLRYFVFFDETNPKARSVIYRASHGGLVIACVVGLILARPEVRRRLGPALLTVGLIATFHSLTIVATRFQIPVEPVLAVGAAASLTRWVPRDQPRLLATS